jgi:hypothetical protein
VTFPDDPAAPGNGRSEPTFGAGNLRLLDLPDELRRRGYDRLELCHFHVPARDAGYLRELRATLAAAGVALQTLLIDSGDIAQPDDARRKRDRDWIARWIETAAALGASHARVIAGQQQPTVDALRRSIDGLRALARVGKSAGVRVITENWYALTAGPAEIEQLLDALEGDVGLLADMGNWGGPEKYANLAAIYGRAERSHTKAHFEAGLRLDHEDYGRCLDASVSAGYRGPHTLIYEGPDDDEWAALDQERAFVANRLSAHNL